MASLCHSPFIYIEYELLENAIVFPLDVCSDDLNVNEYVTRNNPDLTKHFSTCLT